MTDKIKVAVCDDADFLCTGLGEQFENYEQIEFVGAIYSGAECVEFIRNNAVDVLLLDIQMETEYAGIEIIETLKDICPTLKIIMLTGFVYDEYIFSAFTKGADDYCEKSKHISEVVELIEKVYKGTNTLAPQIVKKLVNRSRKINEDKMSLMYLISKVSQLSAGEFELLRMLYLGMKHKEIAEIKCVEIESVRKMENRLVKKMKISNINTLLKQMHELQLFEFIDNMEK